MCPFVQIFDTANGALVTDVAGFFSRIQAERRVGIAYDKIDYFWLQEEHTVTGAPSSTLHICNLGEHLKMLHNDDEKGSNPLAFLQFVSYIGPLCGLVMTPTGFESAREKLLKEEEKDR